MWLPDVITSMPQDARLSPTSRVTPKPPAEFLDIGDHEIDVEPVHERPKTLPDEIAPRTAEDVADEEDVMRR